MARKKLPFTDYAWLRMDDPRNLMVITGLMTFDQPLDIERLSALIERDMMKIRRFRQRIKPARLPFIRPAWEDDPNFSLDSHLERVSLPSPGDKSSLQQLISLVMGLELDYNRPLWHIYLVEHYGPGSALIARMHHGIADGIALMQVLLSLTALSPDGVPIGQALGPKSGSTKQVQTQKSAVLPKKQVGFRELAYEGQRMLRDPAHARSRIRLGARLAAAIGQIALRWPDPPTIFKGPLGYQKRAVWSEPIDLSTVKMIGKTFHGTVNDVLISAAAGALGRYMQSKTVVSKPLNIRGLIPVNLRPIELDDELGNKFGLVFLSLPLGIDNPVERLRIVKGNMDALKTSVEPVATFGVLNLLGAVPDRVEDIAVDFFDTKASSVITNVPGPQTQLYLAGAPINTVMAWVPQSGRISLGISIISYNGKVWLGVASDQGLLPDPEKIVSYFNAEYHDLKKRAESYQDSRSGSLKPLLIMLDQAIDTIDQLNRLDE
jgi:diacylglycerol O-acyltransferase